MKKYGVEKRTCILFMMFSACQCGYWKVVPYPYTTASVLCPKNRPGSWIAFMKVILAAWDYLEVLKEAY